MLPTRTRHVQILPLLCAVCHLTLAFPVQIPPANEDVRQLRVNIPHSGPVLTPLGSSISIPCFVSLSSTPSSSSSSSSPVVPRIKWTKVSGGEETQILVARDQRVKFNNMYRDRAALFNYTSSPDDLSLWLGDLRHSDSGHYRCEVQQGLEDASDIIQVKVIGVVFHYRDTLGRYAFSFQQAQRACRAIGAQIATPDQLLAAYYDGYEQCDAGWLADQSIRYPIQVPREGCYGDMDRQPGVRNYGTMDPNVLYDVYCYIEQIDGEVFHDPIPQLLSFDEARSYCEAAGAELATTAQLYFAWSEGLDRCSPGWLADGSVRYPIVTPREKCGGHQAGVKTLYRFSNQTGFPDPFRLHDVYCFKGKRNNSSESPMDNVVSEAEDIEQNVIILMEKDQEIQLTQQAEQVEREVQSVLESLPVLSSPFTVENLVDTHPTVTSDPAASSSSTASALNLLQLFNETSETSLDSEHPTEVTNTTISKTETYNSTQSTSFSLGVYNGTDFHQNLSFTFLPSELEKSTYKPHTENQTGPGNNFDGTTYLHEKHQKLENTSLSFEISHTNYSDTESNYTQEESFWDATTVTADPLLQVKLEEAAVEDPEQMSLSTQVSEEKETLSTHVTQSPESAIETLTSLWGHVDGSGDFSQEKDVEVEEVTTSHSSTAGFTTHLSHSAVASRAPGEQTTAPDFTLLPGSHYVEKVGSEISVSPHLWEPSVSTQEGSTSVETVDMETDEIQIHTTQSVEWVASKVSLTTTESPEGLNTSQSPSEFATAQNQTSGYLLSFDSSSSAEEASGYEPRTVSSSFQEDIKFAFPFEGQTTASPTHEEETDVSLLMEQVKVTPTHVLEEAKVITTIFLKEGTNVPLTTDKETTGSPTLAPEEGPKAVPTLVLEESAEGTQALVLEEGARVTPTKVLSTLEEEETKVPSFMDLEDEASVAPTIEEEVRVVPTHVAEEEEAEVAPTLDLGEEPKMVTTLVSEESAKVVPTLKEGAEVPSSMDLEDEATVAPTVEEEVKVVPAQVLEEAKGFPTLVFKEEPTVVTTLVFEETSKVAPTFEEEAKVPSSLDLKEEASVAPTITEEVKFIPTLVLKEDTKAAPTPVLKEVKVAPTLVLEEATKVAPTLDLEEAKYSSTLDIEEEASAAPSMEEEVEVSSTPVFKEDTEAAPTLVPEEVKVDPTLVFEEAAKVAPTLDLEEEASAAQSMEEEVKVSPTLVLEGGTKVATTQSFEEVKVVLTHFLEENEDTHVGPKLVTVKEAKVAPTFVTENINVAPTSDVEEETYVAPAHADFTLSPLSSQTSKWSLLTTTTGPQESLNDVEFSQRPSAKAVSESLTAQMSTKPTAAAVKTIFPTITTTTHRFRHIWSPTTTTPKSFHETIELQKVTHVIPPVDQGLVYLEHSLTKPPTLLIPPNERAAVGGAGKSSDACLNDPCWNGGTCTERDGQIRCLCLPTYGGDFCQKDLEECEPGWDKFHGFCYRHFSQRQSWEVAEQRCRMQGAHLVSIMTPEEQDYINSNYKEYQWTGLNDKTIEDDFRWSDGNPLLYENWYRGQPDSYFLSGEDCVVMVWHDSGRWSDVPCNYHLAYTCKKGTSSCGPPPKLRNASIFGKPRQRYEANAVVRYHCAEGFQQRLNPVIKCLSGGRWQTPQILCTPKGGRSMKHLDELSLTDSNFAAAENELEATKQTRQYWDIKF
ncbi:brevican core protein isoform X2 [Kryptolebias marmoratus]|uniref:brevican core protein isoform X2 n=1 Tax=Kryptolebias marmoratus TaxID=37003 RepID=UPI0007F8EC8C|nr:brevican core protein isoform X2 [Kryptolebias marmoratus]